MPSVDEVKVLSDVLAKERSAFRSSLADAKPLAAGKLPAGVDEKEFAAWVMVSRVVLNLDETITRE
jgi:hypothetical protein